jgi:hypothetical protein
VGPVVIAAVFLAIIGASVGFVLGARDKPELTGGASPDVQVSQEPSTPPDGSPPVAEPPAPQPPPDEEEPPTADRCPGHTWKLAHDAGASGDLALKLYVRTNGSEVWICADSNGRLFYQGHRGQPGERLREGDNALFLTDVTAEGDWYVATNSSGDKLTTYRVSPDELVIEGKDGKQTEQVVEKRP